MKKHYSSSDAKTLPRRFATKLVVIDPTDKNRNVAAALSQENLKKFIALCRYFKKNPSKLFFIRKPKTFEQKMKYLKTKGHNYTITLPKPEVVDDVLWGQIKKLMKQLQSHLEKDGFDLCVPSPVADDTSGKVRVGFSVYDNMLPKTIAIEGPMSDMNEHVTKFKKRHRGAKFIERSGRIFTITKRKIRKPEESVKAFFKDLLNKGKSHLAYPLSKIKITRQ
jgi:tRNA nucleotidyltransferase (CCA-adding enzyme)